MEKILESVISWSANSHDYENENIKASCFEPEILEQFTRDIRDWLSSLKENYRNALVALDFDRTIMTSMMFFSSYNSLSWEYECLTSKIAIYLTADDVIACYEKNRNSVPGGLWRAFGDYIYMCEAREKILNKNNEILSKLSPTLKNEVVNELLGQDAIYQNYAKNLEEDLTNYRKCILHKAINRAIKDFKSEG